MKPVSVDIGYLLDDIARVFQERDTGRKQAYYSEVRHREEVVYILPGAWQNIYSCLQALDQCMVPLEEGAAPEQGGPRGPVAALKRLAKRAVRKAVYWYVNPVLVQLHGMHAATDRALHETADLLKNVSDRLEEMERANVVGRLVALEGERFDERVGRLEREWRQGAALKRGGTPSPGAAGEQADAAEPGGVPAGRAESRRRPPPEFQFDYYWFESIHRGDRGLIKRRQEHYLEHFTGCSNVLDIGCGRGEFLELMGEKGIGGYGIDIQADAVNYCVDMGLKAFLAEAVEHLHGLEDGVLDGVFMSQVVEHLTPGELVELMGLLCRKVGPGASVVVETPNPQCLLVFASFFYADLSHVQPVHPETMRFLLLSAGLQDVEIKPVNPVPRAQRLSRIKTAEGGQGHSWVDEVNANFEKLNTVLFSYMDYAAVARKQ